MSSLIALEGFPVMQKLPSRGIPVVTKFEDLILNKCYSTPECYLHRHLSTLHQLYFLKSRVPSACDGVAVVQKRASVIPHIYSACK